ncbi:MAG: hypothetical protein ACRC7C_03455 [Beijerinckiaceae bacterium]
MTDAFTSFNLQLQTHMKALENRFATFNAKVGTNFDHADKELRHQIAALEAKAASARTSVEASAAVAAKWVADSMSSVEEWKTGLDVGMLLARAERADAYARAASEIAISSVDAAEKAALYARLAHTDLAAAKVSRAA